MLTRRAFLGAGAAALVPTGLTAQIVPGDLRGALDASHQGVRPGAPEDQSAALRTALERAAADGRPLFLPPGVYSLADVDLPNQTHLIGVPGESRLTYRGGGLLMRARGGRRLRLEGLVLDGGGRPVDGDAIGLVAAEEIEEVVVEDCALLKSAASGLALSQCAGRVARSRVTGARGSGLSLHNSRGLSVTDNVIEDCGERGIFVWRWDEGDDGTIVRGNRIRGIRADSGGTGPYGNGVNLSKVNGVIVADNRIDSCAFSAVRAYSSKTLQITGNIATQSGETALYVEFASEGAVVADNIIDGASLGISFANFMTHGGRLGVCSGNIVRNLRRKSPIPGDDSGGVGIHVEADMAVTGNVVENAPQCGLQLGWGPYLRDVSATGNVIRRAGIGIAVSVVDGAGPALIAGNVISGAGRGAIVGMRWREIATGELTTDGAERFPHLTLERNAVG